MEHIIHLHCHNSREKEGVLCTTEDMNKNNMYSYEQQRKKHPDVYLKSTSSNSGYTLILYINGSSTFTIVSAVIVCLHSQVLIIKSGFLSKSD